MTLSLSPISNNLSPCSVCPISPDTVRFVHAHSIDSKPFPASSAFLRSSNTQKLHSSPSIYSTYVPRFGIFLVIYSRLAVFHRKYHPRVFTSCSRYCCTRPTKQALYFPPSSFASMYFASFSSPHSSSPPSTLIYLDYISIFNTLLHVFYLSSSFQCTAVHTVFCNIH